MAGGDRNAVTPGEATQPTRNTHDFMRMFKELKTAIVPDGKVAMQVTPVTEEEIALKVLSYGWLMSPLPRKSWHESEFFALNNHLHVCVPAARK